MYKRKKVKFVSLVLFTSIILSSAAGCGNKTDAAPSESKVSEGANQTSNQDKTGNFANNGDSNSGDSVSSNGFENTENSSADNAYAYPTNTPWPTPTNTPTPTPTATPIVYPFNGYTTVYDVPKGTACDAESLTGAAFIAVNSGDGVLLSWRSYTDDADVFTITKNGKLLATGNFTNYLDTEGKAGDEYKLTYETSDGTMRTETAFAWENGYTEFTLRQPVAQKQPNNKLSIYTANDMSVGDLDGDGELELIVKWMPNDQRDNSGSGWCGTTILDGYDLDLQTGEATLMWRIDLGLNISSGAHYTQYQVWDYDSDGIAEIICKTADGTTTYDSDLNETGFVGACSMASLDTNLTSKYQENDYRDRADNFGMVLKGPEYLTAFDGRTGQIIDTVEYVPVRGPERANGSYDISSWGDSYGNRVDRFLSATAYIDDGAPAAIFSRGYYARTAITAWKLIDRKLTLCWYFDCDRYAAFAGQGNHGLSVNDVDEDGYDEIIFGSLCMDNDGSVLWCTGLGHGDAMHVSDWNGDGKIEVWQVHEDASAKYHMELHDAATGQILWGVRNGKDTGRGMAADIDPRYPGAELWAAANGNTYDINGNVIYENKKPSVNASLFWDGDLLMELFDYNNQTDYTPEIRKWNWEKQKEEVLVSCTDCMTSNGTKGNPGLIADICGDWREEVILRSASDDNKIRIYSTAIPTDYTFSCLLTDRAYREGIAWQNVAYNQPANLTRLLSAEIK